jgi:uncharacterized protein DUF4157
MTHWIHPPERDRDPRREPFDPVLEGARHGLARDLALALWQRVCAEATDPTGRRDDDLARHRFHELAARLAARGGRLRPDPGRLTRVATELDGAPPPTDALALRVPGRVTLVGIELDGAHAPADALALRAPGRTTLVSTEARRRAQLAVDVIHDADTEHRAGRGDLPGADDVRRALVALQSGSNIDNAEALATSDPGSATAAQRDLRDPQLPLVARGSEGGVARLFGRGSSGARLTDASVADLFGRGSTGAPTIDEISARRGASPPANPAAAHARSTASPSARLAARGRDGQSREASRDLLERVLAILGAADHGAPLPGELAARMTAALAGAGPAIAFDHVRVHTDETAAEAAELIGAQAFTIGHHIYFARDQFAPGTEHGDRLLRHELTHVAQHARGELAAHGALDLVADSSAAEAEARAAEARPARPSAAPDLFAPPRVPPLRTSPDRASVGILAGAAPANPPVAAAPNTVAASSHAIAPTVRAVASSSPSAAAPIARAPTANTPAGTSKNTLPVTDLIGKSTATLRLARTTPPDTSMSRLFGVDLTQVEVWDTSRRGSRGDSTSVAPSAAPDHLGEMMSAAGPHGSALVATFGAQARSIEILFGSSGAAGARGLARDGRVHIAASAIDWSRVEDRELLGHEIAHALQQRLGSRASDEVIAQGRRDVLEDEADRAGRALARGVPFSVTEPAPPEMSLFQGPRKVVKMTLLRDRGLLILDLEGGTRESVKLRNNTGLPPGKYQYDAKRGRIIPAAGAKSPAGKPLQFWAPLDATYAVTGLIPLNINSELAGHRIQAEPELAEVMPGTKVRYYFATDPTIGGGAYEYRWWCENDPATVRGALRPPIINGPTKASWETTWDFPGRHTVVCEVTNKHSKAIERLQFFQQVRTEAAISNEAFGRAAAPDFIRFRAGLELQHLDNIHGAIQDQRGDGRRPFIVCQGRNPAVPGRIPDIADNIYTIEPSPKAKKFRWTARPTNWNLLAAKRYHGYQKVSVGGIPCYDLGSNGPSAKFIMLDPQVWTIVCEELDARGKPLGSKATYRQVIQTQEEGETAAKWNAYTKRTDAAIAKIADRKDVGVRASYVNRETGQTMSLQLFVGPSASDPKKVMLLDLLPGVDTVEYSGSSIDAALADFATNNSYPKGIIQLEVPANKAGIPRRVRTIVPKGESDWALWSSRTGWASLGLAGAGMVAAVVPGGQPLAAVLFIAAAGTGAASSGMSLYDHLRKAEKSPIGIALDVVGIVGSIVGATGAIRALRSGSTITLAGRPGKFLLYAGFASDAVSGLLVSVEGIDQIVKILDSHMSRGEMTAALVRVLSTMIVQGTLCALSIRSARGAKKPDTTHGNKPHQQNSTAQHDTTNPPAETHGTASGAHGDGASWKSRKNWNAPVKHGKWLHERGDSGWIDERPEVIRVVGRAKNGEANPIMFRSGVVDFSPWSRGEFPVAGLDGIRGGGDMKKIRLVIADRQQLAVGKSDSARTAAALDWLRTVDDGFGGKGLVPHHAGGNKVQLIPKDLHKVSHTDLTVYE